MLKSPGIEKVLIVQNGPDEASLAILKKELGTLEKVEIAITSSNFGYAGGMQFGIDAAVNAGVEFVWLLNNDCEVGSDALDSLLGEMLHYPDTAACSGVVEHGPGIQCNAGAHVDLIRGRIVPNSPEEILSMGRAEVGFVAGSAWMLRTNAIQEVGGLDCRLFLLGEEPDWCFRASRAGWKSVVVAKSEVRADVSASLQNFKCEYYYYSIRNMTWLVRRYGTLSQRLMNHGYLVFFRLPKLAAGHFFRKSWNCLPLLFKGAWAGITSSLDQSHIPKEAENNRLATFA